MQWDKLMNENLQNLARGDGNAGVVDNMIEVPPDAEAVILLYELYINICI